MPGNLFCLSANQVQEIGNLQPGEKKLISYNFVTNNEYRLDTIGFDFKISEKYNRFDENGTVSLTMNQQVSAEKLVVQGVDEKEIEIAVASLTSDVDKNIPVVSEKKPNKVALIFGNEDYSQSLNAEVNVEYARRDAAAFLDYAVKTLGFVQENIYYKTNATAGIMNTELTAFASSLNAWGPKPN